MRYLQQAFYEFDWALLEQAGVLRVELGNTCHYNSRRIRMYTSLMNLNVGLNHLRFPLRLLREPPAH